LAEKKTLKKLGGGFFGGGREKISLINYHFVPLRGHLIANPPFYFCHSLKSFAAKLWFPGKSVVRSSLSCLNGFYSQTKAV